MRQPLHVIVNANGLPQADVPFACMWDLVEYLSYQRISVTYQYRATHFSVTFPRVDAMTAQNVLDEWASANVLQTV